MRLKKNVDAVMISMKKESQIGSIDESSEHTTDDANEATDDALTMENLLEQAKSSFLEL